MKRIVFALALLWPLRAAGQFAPQTWTADQDGGDFLCYDVHSLQVNNMSGVGVRCVEVDSTGTFFAVACSSIGGVSSVTGTTGRTVVTPTTGAVVVDLATFGSSPSCTNASVVVDAYGRSTCTSGTAPVTSVGVTAPITTTGGATPTIGISLPAGQAAYGTGTNVTSDPAFTYGTGGDDSFTALDNGSTGSTSSVFVTAKSGGGFFRAYGSTFGVVSLANHVAFGNDTGNGSQGIVIFGNGFSTSGGSGSVSIRGGGYDTAAENILCDVNGSHFSDGNIYVTAISAPSTPSAGIGRIYIDSTSKNIAEKSDAGVVNHGAQTQTAAGGKAFTALSAAGVFTETSFQAPLTACTDYVSVGCQTGSTDIGGTNGTTTVIGIESDAAMRGDVLATEVATPGAPAAGKVRIYASTAGNVSAIDPSGNINHGIRTQSCGASQYVTGVNVSGVEGCSQPAFTDVSGSLACSQTPAYTGDTTKAGGSCATVTSALTDAAGAGSSHATTGSWGANLLLQTDAGGAIKAAGAACSVLPALTGDVTTAGGTCTTVLTNIPNDTTMAGDVLAANAATPSSPASGHARVFTNSFGNIASVNSSGTVNHGVQTNSCAAHQWLNAIGDPGNSACVQPSYSDLSGTVPGPFRMIFTLGGRGLSVILPSSGGFGGNEPDFWLRPMAYTDSTAAADFYAYQQVWENDAGDAFTSVDLNVYAYQCGISVSAGGQDDLKFEITKNAARSGFFVTVLCPSIGATNTNYRTTGNSLTIAATDRIGVEVHSTAGGTYSSGALRATVTLVLRP